MQDAYVKGFVDKCAEHGLDPVKLAATSSSMYGSFSPATQAKTWGRAYGSGAMGKKQPPAQAQKPIFDQSSVQTAPYNPPPPAKQVRKTYAPD